MSKKGRVAGRWALSSTCFPEMPPTMYLYSTNSSYPFFIPSFDSSIAKWLSEKCKEDHVLCCLKQHPLEKVQTPKHVREVLQFWTLLAFQLHSAGWLQWPPSNSTDSFALSSLLARACSVLYLEHSPAPCRHLPLSLLLRLTSIHSLDLHVSVQFKFINTVFPDPRDQHRPHCKTCPLRTTCTFPPWFLAQSSSWIWLCDY